ncbi:MAG TPA: SRPBCC family protein [Mycobacteriales bacterium]|nr:SRPBCC family protein [Mycobacteriales bacterium]
MRSFDIRAYSTASPERVFALLADATSWSRWAGPMVRHSSWEVEGDPPPGGVGAVRRLGTKLMGSREQILEYDAPHYLAYTTLGRMPMRDYRAIVSCDPDGDGTRITWAGAFEPVVPGTGWLLTAILTMIVGGMAKRLARYSSANP